MARKKSGTGLVGIALILAVLYFSGALGWLWNRVTELDTSCYALMSEVQLAQGARVCDSVSSAIDWLGAAFSHLSSRASALWHGNDTAFASQMDAIEARLHLSDQFSGAISPGHRLKEMMQDSPSVDGVASSAHARLQRSLDEFVIGQYYLQEHAPGKAVAWLQAGAQKPQGYGILSQLTLGDMYAHGSGVPSDSRTADHYYRQALQSWDQLKATRSSDAQFLLEQLPEGLTREQLKAKLR